MEQKNIPKILT